MNFLSYFDTFIYTDICTSTINGQERTYCAFNLVQLINVFMTKSQDIAYVYSVNLDIFRYYLIPHQHKHTDQYIQPSTRILLKNMLNITDHDHAS